MKDKTLECEFCGSKSTTEEGIKNHQKRTAKCLDIQMKKLGKHKYPPVVPRKPKEESKKEPSKKEALKKEESKKEPLTKEDEDDDEDDDISENDEIPFESSDDEEQVEIKTSSEDDSDKEDAISFFKDMGASKFDNIKTFKKKYTTTSREVINDDEKPIVTPATASIDMKEMMNTLVKVVDSVKKLEERVSQLISDNDKKNKELEKHIKNANNTVIDKIEEMFGSTIENNVESSKKILAEIDSKNETLEIFKEDIEETCDKYYEIYKKFKSIKEDMEDMVRGSRRK